MLDYWTCIVGKQSAYLLQKETNQMIGRNACAVVAQSGKVYYLDAVFSADEVHKYELDQHWSLTN